MRALMLLTLPSGAGSTKACIARGQSRPTQAFRMIAEFWREVRTTGETLK